MSKLSYWERRKAQLMVDQMAKAESFADELEIAYQQTMRYFQGQTDKIFDKFRRDYGLTEQQARQILKQAGQLDNLNDLKQVLAAQPNDPNIQRLLADLDSPAYAHRIEQLERTQRQASEIVQALAGVESRRSEEFYARLAEDSFQRSTFELQQQSGLAYHFNSPSESEISSLLRSRWEGGSFSSRIWNNTQSLSQGLKTELLVSLLSGRSDRETAEAIAKRFEAGKYNSRRLVRTESAFFHGQMELKSYEEADVEWYRFVAVLDLRTSSKCQHQDGEIYQVSEAVTGVNYPPLHPWCRSTTIASDDKEWLSKLERRARDPETGKNILVPGDMTYKEWYAKYVEKKSLEKADDKVYNQGMSNSNSSGAISVRRGDIKKQQDEFAERYYNQLRNSKRENIISTMSEHSGVAGDVVAKALEHILDNEYFLWDSEEFEYRMRKFYPHYDMALSLQRLMLGEGRTNDITMLKHEALEHYYMNVLKMSYDDAHKLANQEHNYEEGD